MVSRKKPRSVLGKILLSVLILLPVGILAIGAGLTCVPAWYRPAAINYALLESDKRDATNLLDRIGDELNAGRPIEIEISEAQANRWLTARRELPQGGELNLAGAENPYLSLAETGVVRFAATVRRQAFATVASIGVRFDATQEHVNIHLESVRAGLIPAPQSLLEQILRSALSEARSDRVEPTDGGFRIPNEFTWPNGKRRFRITNIGVDQATLKIRLEPR